MDLPTEILEIIFSHLEFKDRMSATLVCHRWSGTAIPLRKVLLKLAGCWDRSVYETFLASDRRYRHLEVPNIMSDICYTSKLISKFRDSLETLEVGSVNEWSWMNALCGLPMLQYLCLRCPHVINSPNLRPKRPCRSMRSLTIDEIDCNLVGDLCISGLPNLETLEVAGTGVLDDRLLQDLKALPKLRDIKFKGKMLDFNNHAESATIDQIRKVEIRTSVRIDDEQLLQLTKVFPAMDSFLIAMAFPALVSLRMNYFKSSAAGSVRLANLQRLEELHLEEHGGLDLHLLEDFATLPKLRSVKLGSPQFDVLSFQPRPSLQLCGRPLHTEGGREAVRKLLPECDLRLPADGEIVPLRYFTPFSKMVEGRCCDGD
ncbi:hypothetical protein pipiens_009041 [Culex pipiens pipiens]|uniref:F-box domain-containing protein n=1 Tax=Culex pipiens pipiens TaxID=38569 RepID=A0ABD1DF93_CULPP